MREGSFLKHDDDIDIGVIMERKDPADVGKEMIALHGKLAKTLTLPIKTSFKSPVLKIKMASDIVVDLFPTYLVDNKV